MAVTAACVGLSVHQLLLAHGQVVSAPAGSPPRKTAAKTLFGVSRSLLYRGFEEVMRFYADYYAAFEEIMLEAESYTSAGEYVVVPNTAYQRGRDGIEVSARATFVFTVYDGRITRICLYQETQEALVAVGLAD